MRRFCGLCFALILAACQEQMPSRVTLIDGPQVSTVEPGSLVPDDLIRQAGLSLAPADVILANGVPVPTDRPLDAGGSYTLQIRRAVGVTLVRPDGQSSYQSAAASVGQAAAQAGLQLYANDLLSPAADTALNGPLTITYRPARDLSVTVDGKRRALKSSAATVGQALSQAGLPLLGLDYSHPAENAPLPADGQIKIVRVNESISLIQQSIPFKTQTQMSDQLDLDTQNILRPGSPGLSISRVRVRTEDGAEVSRVTEPQTVVAPPVDRVVGYGTRVVQHTAKVDGVTITYWRALQFWATSYHPAETGSDVTASGQKVARGLVSVDYHYIPFGTRMYVPGYGYAESADTGGFTGRWIDLGYPDDQYVSWHQWLTVYFLWPPPAVIPYTIPGPITFKGYAPPGP
jgi:uncharacterized protein YabE (DUF348 family)